MKKTKTHKIIWNRRYLTLDRYMVGNFWPLFRNTVGLSLVIFIIIWFFTWCLFKWSLGHAFIQLTNPNDIGVSTSPGNIEQGSAWEWLPIVVTNLFGLFVLNGVILTLLVNWVSNRKDRHEKGEARYDYIFSKNYVVIIGGHEIVSSLTRDLMSRESLDYVLIQTRRDAEEVRREITAQIENEEVLRHVVIYYGDRTSWHELKELHLSSAMEVYIIGEPSYIDKSSHDSLNMQTWRLMNKHINVIMENKIPCHIMFEYQSTFSAFQYTDLKLEDSRTFRFIPFNIYENWAQQVLIDRNDKGDLYYKPLDGVQGIPYSSPQRVHLIVVGMSKMGVALAIEATHVAHYPNFNNPEVGRPRTLITFIDRNARREMLFFMGRFRELFQLARWRYVKAPTDIIKPDDDSWDIYDTIECVNSRSNEFFPWHDPLKDIDYRSPYLGGYLGEDLIDIDFEFIEGDVALPSIQKYISDACADNTSKTVEYNRQHHANIPDKTSKTTIAVCLPIASEAMSAALYFDSSVYDNVQQIWIQQPESGALVDTIMYGLTGQDKAKFRSMRPFGMLTQCDYLRRINSLLPKIVAYAYECLNNGTSLSEEYHKCGNPTEIIDSANKVWLSNTQEGGKSAISKRWSNIYCANSFDTKKRVVDIDLSLNDYIIDSSVVNLLAKVEHNRWILEQLLMGIRPVSIELADKLPIENEKEEDRQLRKELKSRNIHPDLISNEKLGSTQYYDEEIAKIIPLAYFLSNYGMNHD